MSDRNRDRRESAATNDAPVAADRTRNHQGKAGGKPGLGAVTAGTAPKGTTPRSEINEINPDAPNDHCSRPPSTKHHVVESDGNTAIYMINAGKLATCPKIKITFRGIHVEVILDTGSQVSVLSDDIFRQLKLQGPIMELPVQSVILMSAFGNKTSRVKR
jgi:hypothetical protein